MLVFRNVRSNAFLFFTQCLCSFFSFVLPSSLSLCATWITIFKHLALACEWLRTSYCCMPGSPCTCVFVVHVKWLASKLSWLSQLVVVGRFWKTYRLKFFGPCCLCVRRGDFRRRPHFPNMRHYIWSSFCHSRQSLWDWQIKTFLHKELQS